MRLAPTLILLCGLVTSLHAQKMISGTVRSVDTNSPLEFAHVGISGKNLGTVTNRKGEFSLIMPESYASDTIVISYIGYESGNIPVNEIQEPITVVLSPNTRELSEVVVRENHKSIVEEAIEMVPVNYDLGSMILTGFYRARISNSRFPIQLSETALEIFRMSNGKKAETRVRLLKGRVSRDTASFNKLFNVQAGVGPKTLIEGSFLTEHQVLSKKFLKNHTFKVNDITTFDNYSVYVVEFDAISETGYQGTMLIDTETLAFIRISYKYSDKQTENPRLFPGTNLASRIVGLSNSYWNSNSTVMNFHKVGYLWYLSHINYEAGWTLVSDRNDLNEPMTYTADFVITDIERGNIRIPDDEEFARNKILENQLTSNSEDFWSGYNYLLPDQNFDTLFREIQSRNTE